MKRLIIKSVSMLALLSACKGVPTSSIPSRLELTEIAVERAISTTDAQGLAFALIEDGEVSAVRAYGDRNANADPLNIKTVMYGASLTKTAFAYMVTQLAEEGLLDMDKPISALIERPLPEMGANPRLYAPYDTLEDDRWQKITPRMLLTHSAGFSNFWFLEPDRKMRLHFEPGSRYAYSGDGFILLQYALEAGLGLDVGEEMRKRVFRPSGMTNTDMMWREDFADNLADGWTMEGRPIPHDDRSKVRAAGSMDTTISDMAQFASGLVTCRGLNTESCDSMFTGTLHITTSAQFPTLLEELPPTARRPDLKAALGSVAFKGPQGAGIFKGGHNESTGNTMVCLRESRNCIVLLSNDVRAERAFPLIVKAALGETGVPWEWEYPSLKLITE